MMTTIGDFIKGSRTTRARNNFKARAPKAFFSVLALALGGCAIHPVQQDVTGLKTVEVVDRIRCETRRAIQDKTIDLLFNLSEDPNDPSKRLAGYLQTTAARSSTFRDHRFRTRGIETFTTDISTPPSHSSFRLISRKTTALASLPILSGCSAATRRVSPSAPAT
jgi:hypothetical protein